jgi:protein TIF31
MKIIQAHEGDEIKVPEKEKINQASQILNELFRNPISKSSLNRLKKVKCLDSIKFDKANPISAERKVNGDLFYLTVRTLDSASEFGITCTANGFYHNRSVGQSFNPAPNATNPCFSYSLVGCIHQMSASFGKNLEIYLNSILKTDPYFLTALPQTTNAWISARSDQQLNSNGSVCQDENLGQTIVPLYGLDPKQLRDWNEEFQVVQGFPAENFMQRMQKGRAVAKIYNDFLDAAVKGAQAIIEGKLTSLNPNEPLKQHVYVYNQIFFSFAVDTPCSYADMTTSDASPSFTQANHDLAGLHQLQDASIADLYHLATCLVTYRGHRVICQSIIPGILNNSDLSSLAEYGTVDEKKSLVANAQFHELMLKLAEALKIKTNPVTDPTDGKVVEIAGSVELKGIRGSDKRAYVVDLQGLTPRDANFLGEANHTALVRPELLKRF